MFDRLLRWLSPGYRRAMKKRRLQEIALEAGASRAVAMKIASLYFSKSARER